MSSPALLSTIIFVVVYAFIATERIHKTKAALAGAALMLVLGIIDQHTALHGAYIEKTETRIEGVDWNTILLLIGMMVIVNITRRTGVFEWLAIKCAKWGRGYPVRVMILLCIVTAVVSAMLDNVTTVLLIAPVMILICRSLEIDPVPFLIAVVISSNIGGTATLVGDPPNILIGSSAGLSFMDFVKVNAPITVLIMIVALLNLGLFLNARIRVSDEQRAHVMAFDESRAITDHTLLRKSLLVVFLTFIGFIIHGYLGLEPATIALSGAALLLLLHPEGPEEVFREVEWPTIFFFIGLFIMVAALVETGVIGTAAAWLFEITRGNLVAMGFGLIWMSAIISGFVDNIPYTAMIIPMIHDIGRAHAFDVTPLWWALSLGACLGGNFTIVGAAANVVVAGFAERSGHPITFKRYLKYGIPLTLQSVVIASIYLWLRFLR